MSDKPIENLAVGWLPGVNVPAHPPDAVSGAATPAQQCRHIWTHIGLWTDKLYREHRILLCSKCKAEKYEDHVSPPEPAATAEAQIPEKHGEPSSCPRCSGKLRITRVLIAQRCDGCEKILKRNLPPYYAPNALHLQNQLAAVRAQLAALRVERDRALESLRGYREHHATYGSCRIELTGDHRCKDCRRADSALLARPIPAEPSHE